MYYHIFQLSSMSGERNPSPTEKECRENVSHDLSNSTIALWDSVEIHLQS